MSQHEAGDGSQMTPPTKPPLGRLYTSYKLGTSSESDDVEQMPSLKEPKVWEKHTYRWLVLYLLLVIIMLSWPWVFLGVVARRHGLPAPPTLTKQVVRFAQDVGFHVTLISSALAWIVGFLFSQSVSFFARKWVSTRDTEVSRIHFFANWKGHNPAWVKSRFGLLTLVYLVCFLCVTPAFNALLNPVPLTRTASLIGTELDFSSTEPECVQWIQNNPIPHICDWTTFNNFAFTGCLGENQLVDVLESGRSNMLSLIPNNSESLTFTQLGGIRFLGPIQGVLPMGENGIPAFNTIQSSQFDMAAKSPISYNYTLGLQGLASNISCIYDSTSPIILEDEGNNWSIYTGSCPSGQTVADVGAYPVPSSNNSLGLWACTTPLAESYVVYLRGNRDYASAIGNITCNVSSVRPNIFPVTYSSQTGLFTVKSTPPTNSTSPTTLTDRAIFELQNVFSQSQGLVDNLVSQSVIAYGIKDFGIPLSAGSVQNQTFLRLYESMIQGILNYEATYIRLLYSSYNSNTSTLAPSSCIRPVTGMVESSIIGWEATKKTAAYLVPMTIINLTALALLLGAMFIGKKMPHFDPTDPVSIIGAGVVPDSSGNPKDSKVLSTAVRYSVGPSKDHEDSEKHL